MNMSSRKILTSFLCGALTASGAGCASIKSTMLTRNDSNTGWECIESCGVPITVKVPTHLKVQIQESRYLTYDTIGKTWVPLTDGKAPIVALACQNDFIKTEKIFMVDLKRPAAGTLDFTTTFDNQSITQIQSQITDTTIADVSQAVQGILKAIPKAGAGAALATSKVGDTELHVVNSVRAVAIFDLDDPTWEMQLASFLEEQFGSCPVIVTGNASSTGEYGNQADTSKSRGVARRTGIAPLLPPAQFEALAGSDRDGRSAAMPLARVPTSANAR